MHLVEKDEILFEQEEEKMLQKDSKTSNYYLMGLVESRKRKKKICFLFLQKVHSPTELIPKSTFWVVAAGRWECWETVKGKSDAWGGSKN